MKPRIASIVVALLASLSIAVLGTSAAAQQSPANQNLEDLAETAYIYGVQQTVFYGQRWIYTQNNQADNVTYSGVNRLFNIREPLTPDSGFPVVTPNATTLYGTGFIDLQQEPLVMEVPEITDRYFSVQVMSQYGIFYSMVGKQFNGSKARKYIFLPVDYQGQIPGEFITTDVIQAPSNTGYVFSRIAVTQGTKQEIEQINAYQDAITITPLSQWLANDKKGIANADIPVTAGDYPIYPPLKDIANGQIDKQSAQDYFTLLHLVLNDPSMTVLSDSVKETALLQKLAALGIGNDLDFKWDDLDAATQSSLETGFKSGFDKVRTALKSGLTNMNGWMEVRNAGGFETQWLDRAVMGDAGWAGPDRNVSHTGAFRFVDDQGDVLNSSNNYTLSFDMQDLPPVTEFWSIPIYDKDGYFVNNEIDRFTINSFMIEQNLLNIEDGKLIIYVQHDKPSDPKQLKNWLPAPEGDFRFTARFYGPKMAIIDGSYQMPQPVKAN